MAEIFNSAGVWLSTSTSTGTRNVSNRVMKVTLKRDADEHDDTVMGLTAHSRVIGLESWEFTMSMLESFTTADGGERISALLGTLYTRAKSGLKSYITVSKDSTSTGPNLPTYTGLCVLKNYSPLDGAVGDLLKTEVTFLGSGNLTETIST